jgi:hypothetical protein
MDLKLEAECLAAYCLKIMKHINAENRKEFFTELKRSYCFACGEVPSNCQCAYSE